MKKLLYITPRLDGSGGLPKVFSIKTNYLVENYGYEIAVLTTNDRSTGLFFDFEKIKIINKKIKGKQLFYFINYVKIVKNTIQKQKPDIVIIVDNGHKGFFLSNFIQNLAPKIVFEQHGYRYHKKAIKKLGVFQRVKYSIVNYLIDMSVSKVDKFVVLTEESKSEWKTDKIVTIPNPIWFKPYLENKLQNKKAIAVGRIVYEKGFDILLKIWRKVIDKYPDWTLDIYGKNESDIDLKKLCKELNLTKNVTINAPVKNIDEKFKNASLFLMSSRHEGFGLVLVEAMACGLPCIAFDCPTGPREIISDAQNGYLVPMFDFDEYTTKTIKLIENIELRQQMGKNALESIRRFELEKIMEKWNSFFMSFK